MGAVDYSVMAFGRDKGEAYRRACEEANAVNGHQEGYSGDIQTSSGFVTMVAPPRVKVAELVRWANNMHDAEDIMECQHASLSQKEWAKGAIERVPLAHRPAARKVGRVISEKRGPAGCFELTGKAATAAREKAGLAGKRVRVFIFCGTAAE